MGDADMHGRQFQDLLSCLSTQGQKGFRIQGKCEVGMRCCNSGFRYVGVQHKDRRATASLGEQGEIKNRRELFQMSVLDLRD